MIAINQLEWNACMHYMEMEVFDVQGYALVNCLVVKLSPKGLFRFVDCVFLIDFRICFLSFHYDS